MPITLIESNPPFKRRVVKDEPYLDVAEMFCDTLQGEGVSTGVISTFLRVQGCTLKCVWCDSLAVWEYGNPYTFGEIIKRFESVGLIERFRKGQHLILTGGSPLKQQKQLAAFLQFFIDHYGFKPYVEVENEGVLRINELEKYVDQWNNSPKLANSGMKEVARYKPENILHTSNRPNSWFKFVVDCEEDWEEINEYFIYRNLIRKDQVILMPCGENQEQLAKTRPIAAEMAIKHGVRFSDRLHITIWNRMTGV